MTRCPKHSKRGSGEEDHCLHAKNGTDLVCCWCGNLFVDVVNPEHGRYSPGNRVALLDSENAKLLAEVKTAHQRAGDMTRQRAERAEAEVERWKASGMTELASFNPRLADYARHWEARAEKAEATVKRLGDQLAELLHPEFGQLYEVQRERDEARAEVERLKADLHTARTGGWNHARAESALARLARAREALRGVLAAWDANHPSTPSTEVALEAAVDAARALLDEEVP